MPLWRAGVGICHAHAADARTPLPRSTVKRTAEEEEAQEERRKKKKLLKEKRRQQQVGVVLPILNGPGLCHCGAGQYSRKMPTRLCRPCGCSPQDANVARKQREAEELRERTTRKPRALRQGEGDGDDGAEAVDLGMHPMDQDDDDAEYYKEALGEAPPDGALIEGWGAAAGFETQATVR